MFIQKIHLRNVLSYGANNPAFVLGPLNVLIGPNGAGKSNLIECLGILHASPTNLPSAVGSVADFLWKGIASPEGRIELTLEPRFGNVPLRHEIVICERGGRLELVDETIENTAKRNSSHKDVYYFYRYQKGRPVLTISNHVTAQKAEPKPKDRPLRREDLLPDQSILAQRKDPEFYPELAYIEQHYSSMKIYREWHLGRDTMPRKSQKTDLPRTFLQEDAGNLALVLSHMNTRFSGMRQTLLSLLEKLDGEIEGFSFDIVGVNEMQLYLNYRGLKQPIPATRLSDGTLRYLCLLAILCHPEPPSVVCIEEPEIGLHPDILPTIAQLLKDASSRCQLFVTTHSEALVDSLTDTPESVLICEKSEEGSTLRRLDPAALTDWLVKYRLGQLWTMGELGGNRW
jgi:predicted ATPase